MGEKLKAMGLKLKAQAAQYIEKNPDKVEDMKVQALEALKAKIDEEAAKEAAKIKLLEEAGEGETNSTKVEKLKKKTIGVLKPQVDKLAEKEKQKQAAGQKAEESAATSDDDDEASAESVTPESNDRTADAAAAATATTTKDGKEKIQDVIAELLSVLDRADLSNADQKKALNGLSAAVALKQINL